MCEEMVYEGVTLTLDKARSEVLKPPRPPACDFVFVDNVNYRRLTRVTHSPPINRSLPAVLFPLRRVARPLYYTPAAVPRHLLHTKTMAQRIRDAEGVLRNIPKPGEIMYA